MKDNKNKNIVILGAGFAGIQAALKIDKQIKKLSFEDKYNLKIIDQNKYHTFTPLLYEIATTSKSNADHQKLKSIVTWKIKNILEKTSFEVIKDKAEKIDTEKKIIETEKDQINFEHLITTLGAEPYFPELPGLEENALPLKTFEDAIKIRNKILEEFKSKGNDLKVLVGGAGPTGIELAGEIMTWKDHLSKRVKNKKTIETTLVQGAKSILPHFNKSLQNKARKRLEKLGVKIITDKFIEKVEEDKAVLENEQEIPFDVMLWAGGVKANSITEPLPFSKNKEKRVHINNKLQAINNGQGENIYLAGDISKIKNNENKELDPKVARVAIVQGRIAAHNLIEDIKKQQGITEATNKKEYKPKEYPYILAVGGKFGLAKIGGFILPGFFAWVFKGLVELNYLLSILPITEAFKVWIEGLIVFIKNDRLG